MKHKGGNVYGSIYERKRKDRSSLSYTAEIQFQGQTIRRSMTDKDALREWMDDVCEKLNSVLDEYNSTLDLEILAIKNKLWSDTRRKIKEITDAAKQYDLRNRVCADRIIPATKGFQTYLIKDEESGLTKIGKSKNIRTRMTTIGTKNIQLIAYAGKDIEIDLHKSYKSKRVKGEWFDLSDEDINKIIVKNNFVTPGVFFI